MWTLIFDGQVQHAAHCANPTEVYFVKIDSSFVQESVLWMWHNQWSLKKTPALIKIVGDQPDLQRYVGLRWVGKPILAAWGTLAMFYPFRFMSLERPRKKLLGLLRTFVILDSTRAAQNLLLSSKRGLMHNCTARLPSQSIQWSKALYEWWVCLPLRLWFVSLEANY